MNASTPRCPAQESPGFSRGEDVNALAHVPKDDDPFGNEIDDTETEN